MATSMPLPAVEPQPMNLLQRLKIWLVVLLAVDGLFFYAAGNARQRQENVIHEIGVSSKPSVIAAREIAVAISDMDAEAANAMLLPPGAAKDADEAFEKRRGEAAQGLISAAKNITYPGEEDSIKVLQDKLGQFETAFQQARDFHAANDARDVREYRIASKIVTGSLLPEAEKLNKINDDQLQNAYASMRAEAKSQAKLAVASGVFFLALLIFAQVELQKRTRRLINPGLLAASVILVLLVSYLSSRLSEADRAVYVAKHDAFDSLSYLWKARALAFAANADESKYLLGGNQPEDQASFFSKADEIKSLLANERSNVTFEGEGDAANETVKKWGDYLRVDETVRALQTKNQHAEAVKLCLGKAVGQSDYDFEDFDKSLMKTITINDDAFKKAIDAGNERMGGVLKMTAFGTGLIAVLGALGLFVRIREFM